MKLFKSVDEQLEDLGFVKVETPYQYEASYKRTTVLNELEDYTLKLDILYKANGQSTIKLNYEDISLEYEYDEKQLRPTLTYNETILILKKCRQLKKKYQKEQCMNMTDFEKWKRILDTFHIEYNIEYNKEYEIVKLQIKFAYYFIYIIFDIKTNKFEDIQVSE